MDNLRKGLKRIWLLVLLLALCAASPLAADAQEEAPKVVRVGWYESNYCYRDRFGRRRGIDYEYQHKIATYTGWTYEYVEDSWANLLQKLMAGEIDLLGDVSYTEARTATLLYPDLPVGTESYYIYIDADNKKLSSENPASFNGTRIGVNKGAVQEEFLRRWAQRNNISIEIIPLSTEETDSAAMLNRGEIDGYATVSAFRTKAKVVPACRIGASDYFYAVNKNRPISFRHEDERVPDGGAGGLDCEARHDPRRVPGELSAVLRDRPEDGRIDGSAQGLPRPCREQPEGVGPSF